MRAARPAQTTPVPGATAAVGRGQRLRAIIAIALKRRAFLVRNNLCRMPAEITAASVMRLEVWLERNPCPSDATVERFDGMADVSLVLPSNAEGAKLMNELRDLLRTRS